jgi:hypothetical protein
LSAKAISRMDTLVAARWMIERRHVCPDAESSTTNTAGLTAAGSSWS